MSQTKNSVQIFWTLVVQWRCSVHTNKKKSLSCAGIVRVHLSRLWTDTQVRKPSANTNKLRLKMTKNKCTCHVYGQIHKWDPKNWSNDARNPIKQNKTGKIFRGGSAKRNRGPWNPRYKYFNLSNLTKNQGFHSRQGESSTAPLNTPVQGEPLTTRSATPAVDTHPHYLWAWLPTVWTERGLSQRATDSTATFPECSCARNEDFWPKKNPVACQCTANRWVTAKLLNLCSWCV